MSHLLHQSERSAEQAAAHALRPRHALSTLGVEDPSFVDAELTLAREAPAMVPLDLGNAEDRSMADALAAIDALLEI